MVVSSHQSEKLSQLQTMLEAGRAGPLPVADRLELRRLVDALCYTSKVTDEPPPNTSGVDAAIAALKRFEANLKRRTDARDGLTSKRPIDLPEDARAGTFDVIVAESIDRLSRDQEHIAAFDKAMSFAGVAVVTTSEGDINELHLDLKGTMSALYLKDLADKTRRGLEGRVRKGKSGGGICYGYGVLAKPGSDDGEGRGHRYVIEDEAIIIRRIFKDYDAGKSPKSIAHALNRERVPGPKGGHWSPSTIYGNWRRGTGILNNELYIDRMV